VLEGVHWKFYESMTIVGDPDYRENITRIALNSNGAIQLDYIESVSGVKAKEIEKVMVEMSKEYKNGE